MLSTFISLYISDNIFTLPYVFVYIYDFIKWSLFKHILDFFYKTT